MFLLLKSAISVELKRGLALFFILQAPHLINAALPSAERPIDIALLGFVAPTVHLL